MGTSNFSVPILKSLYQNGYPISAVYTRPPKKSNRGQKLNKSPIHLFSENISLDVRHPQSLKIKILNILHMKKDVYQFQTNLQKLIDQAHVRLNI